MYKYLTHIPRRFSPFQKAGSTLPSHRYVTGQVPEFPVPRPCSVPESVIQGRTELGVGWVDI